MWNTYKALHALAPGCVRVNPSGSPIITLSFTYCLLSDSWGGGAYVCHIVNTHRVICGNPQYMQALCIYAGPAGTVTVRRGPDLHTRPDKQGCEAMVGL